MWVAAAAKLLQLYLTLCDPIDGSPPGSAIPGILQARTLEWVAMSFSNAWKWKWSCAVVSNSSQPHGLQPTRLLHPWDFPGKSTEVGCHCLLQWMWELDYKESWALKHWCFWSVVLEKTLESPLDWKGIKPASPKGNQSWIFIGRTDAEAETPILWPCDAKNWLLGKDPDAGKDWRQEEKGTTENEMVGWHHWIDGHKCEHALGVDDGQGSLACCILWGCKESDMTERLNWTEPVLSMLGCNYLYTHLISLIRL